MELNYIKKNEGELTIVFIHGNSFSSKIFINQFSDPIFNNYSLMAMDLPGHGDSPIPANKENTYSVTGLANLLAEFINEKIIGSVILVGYSLSGNLVIEIAPKLNNVLGIFFNGTPPVSSLADIPKGYLPETKLTEIFFEDKLDEAKMDTFCRYCNNDNYEYDELIKEMIMNTDKNFRSILGSSVVNENFGDEIKILNELKVPIAILHGAKDKIINSNFLEGLKIPKLWKNKIHIIDNSPHLIHLVNAQEFNALLNKFVNEINS